MNLLAIDTSSQTCSIALLANGKVSTCHETVAMQQARFILPLIQTLLASENININQIDAIAFSCGPGSFTGIRIGAGVAQGLAFGLSIPVIPVSSLAAAAQAAYEAHGWRQLIVAMDARINEIYWAAYEVADRAKVVNLVGEEMISLPQALKLPGEFNPIQEWCGVGNGWTVYAGQIPISTMQCDAMSIPLARAVLSLALPRYQQKQWVSAKYALPVYLRNNVAVKQEKS